jgi:uncharacterized protein YjdB
MMCIYFGIKLILSQNTMNNRLSIYVFFILLFTAIPVCSQKVIFLHHSIGNNLYNQGNVAGWFNHYDSAYGKSFHVEERSFPNTPWPWDNYPYDYWKLWADGSCDSADLDIECLNKLASKYDMVILKHCAPGSFIQPNTGHPDVTSKVQTIENYQLQYRALLALFDSYPGTKFMIWTLAPLYRETTNPGEAKRAYEFVQWVKNEWLREDGKPHPNIYLFDFFSLVAELDANPVNGMQYTLKYEYEGSHIDADSHPNLLANQRVGPLFAQAIVDAFNPPVIKVSGITVTSVGSATTITSDGGTLQLSASVLPVNATRKTVAWSIQNGTGAASIDSTGLVKALANGNVTAVAASTDSSGISGSLSIIITGQVVAVTGITVTGAGGADSIVTPGGTLQLSATILPANATNDSITWSIQNGTGQASIDSTGLVTAITNGTVTVIATSTSNSGISDSLMIKISGQAISVTGITVTAAGGVTTISTPGGTLQLSADILPDDASNKAVEWSLENGTGQGTISSGGLISAAADGDVTARATAMDGSGVSGILPITIENQNLPTGIDNHDLKSGFITVNRSEIAIHLDENDYYTNFSLYNLFGTPVLNHPVTGNPYSVDISSLVPGIYMVVLTGKYDTKRVKVFVP